MRVILNGLQAGNLSGTGRYTTELARRLPGLSDDVEYIVIWPKHVLHPRLVSGVDEAFVNVDAQTAARRLHFDQIAVRAERVRLKADVVHFPANIGPIAPMQGTVLTIHDLSFFRDPTWYRRDRAVYYRFAVERSVRVASRIIVDSVATAADLHDMLRVPESRIDIIPLGVGEELHPASAEQQSAARGWYKLPESFFLFVGTVEPRKNLVRLIQAWSRIAATCPHDLVIAGREGWKTGPVRTAAASSPHSKRIHFPGFIAHDDLPAVLSAAHAFVWPSLWEGFGLPPLEAMACGTPAVVSDVSSLPEVVGDAALAVDPNNVDRIAGAMQEVATNTALRDRLKTRGLSRAAMFTWERTAKATLNTYRAVMGRP
jgi:glycosyltransferase involved in cell wall biosynthesis